MTIKQKIKKTVEWTLISMPLWVSMGVTVVDGVVENHRYNSLSNQEKIVYLEDKLNSSYYKSPPQGVSPQMGGAILALWNEKKNYMQEELSKLKGE